MTEKNFKAMHTAELARLIILHMKRLPLVLCRLHFHFKTAGNKQQLIDLRARAEVASRHTHLHPADTSHASYGIAIIILRQT